jgi:GNAT superfamily N-acetyltransferase
MHVEEHVPEIDEERFVARFRGWGTLALVNANWRVWVAILNRRLVGHVYLERVDKVPRPKGGTASWGYLTAFYVERSFRSRGIGRLLLSAAIEWATSAGLEFVQVWPNLRSVSLYKRMGFVADEESLALQLKT